MSMDAEPEMADPAVVGVVICTLGGRPEMLAEAVASVLEQSYPGRISLLVVMDGEGPLPAVPATATPGRDVRVLRNTGTPGLAGARNLGLARTQAAWLATLDDDDVWERDKLERQLARAADTERTVLVGSGITVVGREGELARRPARFGTVTHADLLHDRISEVHPSTFLMRTQAVRDAGGWDEQIPGAYAEDYDLVLRLSTMGELVMVRDPLVQVRWSGGSYFFSRWLTIADALEYLLAKHPDFASDRGGHARVLGQIAFARAAAGERREATRTALRALRRNPAEPRAYLALAVGSGATSADRVQAALHRRGRGV